MATAMLLRRRIVSLSRMGVTLESYLGYLRESWIYENWFLWDESLEKYIPTFSAADKAALKGGQDHKLDLISICRLEYT